MKRLAAAVLAAIMTTATSGEAGSEKQQAPAEVLWLEKNAIRFDTPVAGDDLSDLKPMKAIVGDARIVGLGEVTHGTREQFQMKHRLLQFLATEMGFTIFSIEASTPEAYRLNEYVLGGEGDPKSLIAGMYFWTWNTEEVLAMVEWMRDFNASGGGPIQFTGFDMQTPDVAADVVVDFLAGFDPENAERTRAKYDEAMAARKAGGSFGVATWSFPVEAARGKRLKYTGYIKTENVRGGWAGLWWRVDCGDKTSAAFDNMMGRGPTGTSKWGRYSVELDIPDNATNINFGVLMPGDGTSWFDKLRVELDGLEYEPPGSFDFNFEAESIKGFFASNNQDYAASLVSDVAYSGKQSLRIEKLPDDGSALATLQEAARLSGEVLADMEAGREAYMKHADAAEVEWAIHNADIVDQCMRSRAGNTFFVRDKSMAKNVEWIMAQNPGAKVVLWAHNGHIARLHEKMGWHLDERFGEDYLPVGFTAAGGRYRAVGEGSLGEHDLAPPPEGSIEAICAATGEPRLIVDLRPAAAGAAGSGWLAEPRMIRSIGAMATDVQFYFMNIPEAFDVLIYFEDTSASIPLGAAPATQH
jgi:erythromycin esterase-like protein